MYIYMYVYIYIICTILHAPRSAACFHAESLTATGTSAGASTSTGADARAASGIVAISTTVSWNPKAPPQIPHSPKPNLTSQQIHYAKLHNLHSNMINPKSKLQNPNPTSQTKAPHPNITSLADVEADTQKHIHTDTNTYTQTPTHTHIHNHINPHPQTRACAKSSSISVSVQSLSMRASATGTTKSGFLLSMGRGEAPSHMGSASSNSVSGKMSSSTPSGSGVRSCGRVSSDKQTLSSFNLYLLVIASISNDEMSAACFLKAVLWGRAMVFPKPANMHNA